MTNVSDDLPLLAIVLGQYGQDFFFDNNPIDNELWRAYPLERKQWRPLIKRLIHKEADLHVLVPRKGYVSGVSSSYHVTFCGIPLDVLFEFRGTPDEARAFGAEWLELLATKGHDVVAYLRREMFSYSSQNLLTYPTTTSFNSHP